MDQGKKVASFRPHLDAEVYKSALTTSYSSKGGQWITDVDIPHYGWKAWVEPALSGNNSIRLVADLYFTCKERPSALHMYNKFLFFACSALF